VLAVRAAKQRTLIAALLLRAGRVVSVDHLIETLWDGRPPPSAMPSLRNYVLRLRVCLGEAGSRIGFRDRGYVIEVDDDEVDLLRFTRFGQEGTAAFERSQFALAARLLGRALKQWRGPALVDVESDALHREESPQLAESRLDVLELWLEAESRTGGRMSWTAELRDLARAHPERERLWEHLIRSLHSDGRRMQALAEYGRMERTLAKDFGVRPGERLRSLHELIRDDAGPIVVGSGRASVPASIREPGPAFISEPVPVPELIAAEPSGGVQLSGGGGGGGGGGIGRIGGGGSVRDPAVHVVAFQIPVPFQIPAAPADFTGRERETAQLVARLTGAAAVGGAPTVVSGQPGIGKTALALHAALAVRGAFPGGVLYADLRASSGRPARPADVLASFLKAYGRPARGLHAGLDDRAALLRSLLAHRRTLVVLDDAEDCAQTRALLPGPGAGAALITSRTRLDELCGVAHLEPGPLSAEASARLIAAIAGRARTAAEPRPVAELARLCEGVPLALRAAGTRLAARPERSVRWLVERLTAEPGALLDELGAGLLDVRAALAGVYRRLDPDQARAFRTLVAAADQGAGVSVPEAARLLGVEPRRAETLLEQLVDRYLLACGRRPGHYEFRPLALAYGRATARRPDPAASPSADSAASPAVSAAG
jgi:DNA-binding SARP family transcriptional activator